MRLQIFNNSELRFQSKYLILLLFSFIVSSPVLAQPGSTSMEMLAGQLHTLSKKSPAELVYLQTNKGIFETGEDLWFKAYVLNSHYFTPSMLSQTLYMQVINEMTGEAVWNEKYEIQDSFTAGHVFLQDTLSEGNYLLAAYTGYSFFDDSTQYQAIRKIRINKEMKPHLLITADFNRSFYKSNDSIKVKVTALSEQGVPPFDAEIEAKLMKGDKILGQTQAPNDKMGQANLIFSPQSTCEGLKMDLKVKYSGREEAKSFPLPCKKGSAIQFDTFPEGGNLVADIPSNLAFKAVNIDGNPMDITGTLFEDDKSLLEFKSIHGGTGNLRFTPLVDKKYTIRISKPLIDSVFILKNIFLKGVSMRLDRRDKDYLFFNVTQNPGLDNMIVYLRGQVRGIVCCLATGILNKELKIKIPLNEFPEQGIAEFTLFNQSLEPVAERLVYVNYNQRLYIDAKLDKEKYFTRGKAVLKIRVTDENGEPVKTNLGVSVYDKLYQNPKDSKDILTHCCLSAQLKGRIYDPAFYFDVKNKGREEALDLLLLTQGWRRYVWSEENLKIFKDSKQVIFDGTEGEIHATKKLKKALAVQQFVKAFSPGKDKKVDFIPSDSAGRFTITPQNLKTGQGDYIYLQSIAPVEFQSRINLSNPFQTINEIRKKKEMNYPESNVIVAKKAEDSSNPYVEGHNMIKLDEITIKGQGLKIFRDKYMGHLDSLAKLDLNTDYVCFSDYLNCQVHENDKRNTKPVEGKVYSRYVGFKWVNDGKAYVASSEITEEYHYPKFTEEELLKRFNLSRVKAYYGNREFYQPIYDLESPADISADYRNTLLWKPSIATNEKGEATLEFFCSDINTGFVGKIEGISSEGLMGVKDFEFKVQKSNPFKLEK